MKILPISILFFISVTIAFVIRNDDKNMIILAEKAVKEMYDKHPSELKNFGPFLEEYYIGLPKLESEVAPIDDNEPNEELRAPLQIETVFADVNQNDYLL